MILKHYKTLLCILLITIFSSCTDLSEDVYDRIIAEETELTAKDLNSIIAPVYISLRNQYFGWHGFFDSQEECADLIVTPARPAGWVDGGVYQREHLHTWDFSQSHPARIWSSCFSGISNVNRALFQLEGIELDNKESYIAELRGMRALFYYILCDNIGNVPIETKYEVPEGYLPTQNTRQEVFDFVISEINEILDVLPQGVDQSTYGRFTKWTGLMLLGKMYLNAEVYTGTAQWDKCLNVVDEIIESDLFSLESSYKNNFKTKNDGSAEQIFSIPFDEIYAGWFHYHLKTLHPVSQDTYGLEAQPWGGSCAIPQFIDTYDPDDSRLKDTWIAGPQLTISGEPLMLSSGVQLDYTKYVNSVFETEENEGYRFGKYEIAIGALGQLSNDVPFFRYADALMMKAECLLRTGDAHGAATIVTQVRQRNFASNPSKAIVNGAQLTAGSSYNYGVNEGGVMITEQGGDDIEFGGFYDELAWEFVGEHHRRQDMIRFGTFTTKQWFSHTESDDFRTLFPVPKTQMDKNLNLVQNPGYE
ncbi:Starch-binding associating with outer membrane [Mariniphaga anaerophila]|uniref:Starch-binding associating with outer membrane n=1 Tax=Mariniphaga anaerophila TaxID=1484053 RepID=A0A1M5FM95_9BACT|nr:RagB/SusD family nutrient uptake outer membrane protein [Mariniphaga anaerophila]SHF92301.1 Starch-binding associating with outer membrane [Mariniphaga anaerophila]